MSQFSGSCELVLRVQLKSAMPFRYILWFASLALAAAGVEKPPAEAHVLRKAPGIALEADASGASGNYEIFKDLVVAAGKSLSLDSKLDYSSATAVAVSVYCDACGSAATALTNLLLHAYWSVPEATYYAPADAVFGSAFPYWDAGGAMFTVYGSQFRLLLQNKGEKDLKLSQVVLFRRSP